MTASSPGRLPQWASLLNRSLPARLTAAFLALSVTAVLLATSISYRFAESALRERLLERLDALADRNVEALDEWLERQRLALEFTARLPLVRDGAARLGERPVPGRFAAIDEALHQSRRDILSANAVSLLAVPGGLVVSSTDSATVGAFAVDQLYYERGRASTYTQNIYPAGAEASPTLTIATPVRAGGRTVAVLAAHLDLQEMERVLRVSGRGVPIDVYLVTQLSDFVSSERFGREEFRRGIHSVGIDRAIARENGSALYADYRGRAVLGVWRWIPEQEVAMVIEAPQEAAFAPARRLLFLALLGGLVATGLLTLGVVAITRRATRPVLATAAAAERVARGDFDAIAPVESDDEVGRLAQTFNAMTAQLRTLYEELNDQVQATREALREAQASRSLLQDVADHTTALVCVVGEDDRIRLANNRFAALIATTGAPPVGRRLAEVLAAGAASTLGTALEDSRRSDDVVEREVDLATGPESHTWHAVCFPLRDPQGRTFAIGLIATDLTERARVEEERRHRDATVQQVQKLESLGIMAGGIAHDFNNILGAVLGNTELALEALEDREAVRESLQQVAAAARRASDLTRQMLAYAGKASFKREVNDLRLVLQEMVALVRAAQSKKVEFVVTPMPSPLWVQSDDAQLAQVALNLLTNAAESIGNGVGTVTLSASRIDGRIRVSIQDTGAGMSPEVQQRMFEPFYTTKGSGRGLGLSAVRGIIRSCDGELELTSALGEGTRVDIYVPAAAAPASVAKPVARPSPSTTRRGTVLVVDDEEALRRVCRRILEPLGLEVIEAPDGLRGVEEFLTHRDRISLVVLDLTMPGMGGGDVLKRIRAERHDLPVIIASGYDATDRGEALPIDDHTRFLQKPFGVDTLTRVVGELLG